jgi:hypothetical protein
MTIACVVPTIRPAQHAAFVEAWAPLFQRHNVELITVWDGDVPAIRIEGAEITAEHILGPDADLIYHRSDVCRNLGFAYIAAADHLRDVEYILTLDDDCFPHGDTIGDHLAALGRRYPISWMSSSPDAYTRGFPYGVRDESEAMVSHGVWYGNADWDAQTQLANGNAPLSTFYRGPVPKGVLFPFCGMNVMIRRKVLRYFYFAPMGPRASLDGKVWDRFGDIWLGVVLKRQMDRYGWAMVSGYAAVEHTRGSNVQVNLRKEATGREWNERFWREGDTMLHPYFAMYLKQRYRYATRIEELMEAHIDA